MPFAHTALSRGWLWCQLIGTTYSAASSSSGKASTVALANSLGLRMVAEGVETDVAYSELARLGCDQAQGYYMCRPVPATELDHWLNARQATDKPLDIPQRLPSSALD